MGVVTVTADGTLVGVPVGSLEVAVAAIRPEGGSVEAIPSRSRVLAAGDSIYVVARPALLRRLETAAKGETPAPNSDGAAADD